MVAYHFLPLLPVHPTYPAGHDFALLDQTPGYSRFFIGYVASALLFVSYEGNAARNAAPGKQSSGEFKQFESNDFSTPGK
jgi:hypothetical protein